MELLELIQGVLGGDPGAVSRSLSCIVDERAGYEELWSRFYAHSGKAHKVGFSGPPGSGKSTLIGGLIGLLRSKGRKVGVLAVDPTSPFTGGAFLGDRLRIQDHALDSGVFIRSLATRGTVGGLTANIFGAIHVLEASGCDVVLLETVGTGQDEVDVAKVVDSVVYVTAPSLGDEIQALKAGSMEIGDVFVMNKMDLQGHDRALADLRRALALGEPHPWNPPALAASAAAGKGLAEVLAAVESHHDFLLAGPEGEKRRKAQALEELTLLLTQRLSRDLRRVVKEDHLRQLLSRETDPVTLGRRLAGGLRSKGRR